MMPAASTRLSHKHLIAYLCTKFSENMLQVAFIRQHREEVLQRLAVKNFKETELVDDVLGTDDRRKRLKASLDETQAAVKVASREIHVLLKKGEAEEAEHSKNEVATLKQQIGHLTEELQKTEQHLEDSLLRLPNLPHATVPAGTTPDDNEIVRKGGEQPVLSPEALPHWELAKKYDLMDTELGNKITGSGFPVYKGQGARLQRALISYFLDYNITAGYTEYIPPYMVNEASAYGTGQLPDKEAQMYQVTLDNFYLIPTAEVPLTNIYRDVIIPAGTLPVKMTAYTPCFRREAGSYGKEVRGLNRVHQFDKVEIVQIVHPDHSYDVLEEMVAHVEKLLQNLKLPYRVLRLCGGDLSFTSALTYDFEVYSAAQQRWLEVSSVSNFESFQTNRMKIRTKDDHGKSLLLHSLNGSSLALPRIVACLLENNQQPDGIALPEALQAYFGKNLIS
jgi:seryl-tRNA synthetase